MFGCGTFTLLLVYTVMGPTVFFILVSVTVAFAASFAATMYKAELSDKTLAQDLALIQQAYNTTAILAATPTQRDVVSYYTRTTDLDYRLLALLVGPGLHTRLCASHPISSHAGNARQVMYVLKEVAEVHAIKEERTRGKPRSRSGSQREDDHHRPNNNNNKTRILEIGFGRGYCTLMLAGLLPPADYEFHGIDIVARHVEVARRDAAKKHYPNVEFYLGDAGLASGYPPCADEEEEDDATTTTHHHYDVIFAVESLCHAADTPDRMRSVLSLAAKHLAPDGRLVIVDGFRSENFTIAGDPSPQASNNHQQLAMRLAERAFGIRRMPPMSEWIEGAYAAGLGLRRLDCLTNQALPFWTLGWRFAHAFLRHAPAWVVRRLRATPSTARSTDNLLAAATVAHAMRDRAAAAYGVMVFGKTD